MMPCVWTYQLARAADIWQEQLGAVGYLKVFQLPTLPQDMPSHLLCLLLTSPLFLCPPLVSPVPHSVVPSSYEEGLELPSGSLFFD